MLSQPAASTTPSVYRKLAQQQFSGLLLRLALLVLLGWTLHWHLIPLGQWHLGVLLGWVSAPFAQVSLVYTLISCVLFFAQMIWVNKRWLFVGAGFCDGVMSIALLAIFPGAAVVGFAVSASALLALLQGLSGRFILIQSLVLGASALVIAHLAGILVGSAPEPVHGLQALLVIFALVCAWRFEKTGFEESELAIEVNAISGLPRINALRTSLHYLLPYHQRNKFPMSLVMIRVAGKVTHSESMQHLAGEILGRIRKSDVLTHWNTEDFIILLCDTPIAGASQLSKDLAHQLLKFPQFKLTFAVSQIALDNAALDPLLKRMHDALEQAKQQQTDRIIFVKEEKQEHISL